jgi:hypothetical protein
VATLALVAAGCGSDEPETSATTEWAGDLCTAVDTWRDDISSVAASVTSNPTREGLEDAANEAKESTETLIDTLRDLGAPETESGEEAQAAVEDLSDELESDLDAIDDALDDVSSVQGLLDAASQVSAAVSSITSAVSTAFGDLGALADVGGELQDAFAEAEACDGVAPSGS